MLTGPLGLRLLLWTGKTVPLPDPVQPVVTWIQLGLPATRRGHPAGIVTETLKDPPLAVTCKVLAVHEEHRHARPIVRRIPLLQHLVSCSIKAPRQCALRQH